MFESTEINGMKVANRFIRSATWEGMATDKGGCTAKLIEKMAELASGGVGLIITGHAYIRPDGQASFKQLGIYEDSHVEGLRQMTQKVHGEGGRIVVQLSHAGFSANAKLTGHTPVAPSQVEGLEKTPRKVLTEEGIGEIVKAFGLAAGRAKDAGFDGIQIHVAHGYLLSQFISPVFNVRTDQYGGSVENRARILIEVIGHIRSIVGNDYPMLIKLNSGDYLKGGLTLENSAETGLFLEKEGADLIELSGGTFASGDSGPVRGGINKEEKEAYFKDAGKTFKEKLNIPISLVGGIRSYNIAEQLVSEGYADYISLSRPLIREPDLIKRWASGDYEKAGCISDSKCFEPAMAGEGLYCVVERKLREKKE